VAGASTAIWTRHLPLQRRALVAAIDDAVERLERVRAALAAGDATALAAWNEGARDDRRRLLEADLAGGPVHELRATVPNRPGVIADLALALGRGGVNILDMALHPAPDGSTGVVALWIAGDERARHAVTLLAALGLSVARA
jgi:prephenate dehydrogenase